jgi:3'-5' exonuclease
VAPLPGDLGRIGGSSPPTGAKEMKYLCLDIEAVVDLSVWTPPEDEPDQFAPPYAWRPICVGLVLLDDGSAGVTAKRIGAIDDADERALLVRFGNAIGHLERSFCVVTWNGRAYDLPVLMLRSARYGLSHPWYYQSRDTRYRFSEEGHLDLCDAMGDYGASRRLHLDGMARLIGLPGKFGDVTGASVGQAYAAGRLAEITSYCIADAVSTAFLWLRWRLLKGESLDWYQAAAGRLMHACDAEPRLTEFCARVDRRVLLLEGGERATAEPTSTSTATGAA